NNSSSSDSESNSESVGRQFTDIWKEIEIGEKISRGVYKGKCIHCNKEFRRAKPIKTRTHIANECPTNLIVKHFNKSYIASNILKTLMEKYKIVAGGLKYYVETRWITFHECIFSIIRLKKCLEEIRDEFAYKIANNKIITILKSRGFFDNIQYLMEILTPIKFAILEVEGKTGLKFGVFPKIAYHAGILWKSLGNTQESFESLITQLREYKMQVHSYGTSNAYAMPYTTNQDTPLSWWTTCEVNPNEMNTQTLESIAKVHRFNISQIKSTTQQIKNNELNINDIYTLVNSMFHNFEEDDDSQDEEVDQHSVLDSTNIITNDLELEIKTIIDFNSQIFEPSNNNKDDLIENENFNNNKGNFEDYDPQTIIQNMGFDKV
ncbi:15294_t:CDS:2, partial [Racocetra fulgida]